MSCRKCLVLLGLTSTLLMAWPAASRAQVAWEYDPYKIDAWVGFVPAPEFTPQFAEATRRKIEQLAEIEVGSPWALSAVAPMPGVRDDLGAFLALAADAKQKKVPQPSPEVKAALANDKLLFVDVQAVAGGYEIVVQEFDGRTRTWGDVVRRLAWQLEGIPYVAFAAAAEAFVPLVRIESVADKDVQARLRAGGLLLDRPSPARVADGSVLRPVIRRNDRYGEPRPGGVLPAPWTYLQVKSQQGALLACELHSGMRGILGAKATPRNERLALVVRPLGTSTRLVIQSRAVQPQPLSGYEIYEPGESDTASKLLGVTDWRGALDVPRIEAPLRTLIVKSGGQLLARLPLVPGLAPEERADMVDNQKRLEAEGAVAGLSASFLDIVARREVLAARIRKKIKAQDFPGAQQLIDELRILDSRTNLSERLDQFQRDYTSADRKVQVKLDRMFSETRALMNKHLDMNLANRLTGELTTAKAGKT